jgi:hypothetical protein
LGCPAIGSIFAFSSSQSMNEQMISGRRTEQCCFQNINELSNSLERGLSFEGWQYGSGLKQGQ